MQYWLMKSEPEVYGIDHLKRDGETAWEGVRNYQARNSMMNDMRIGDQVLFYHSNAEPPGVAGLASVCSAAHPDMSGFNKKSDHFEPKATKDKPIWFCVDVKFVKKFSKVISLEEIRKNPKLQTMRILQKGSRLSITPVSKQEFEEVLRMSQ